MEIKPKERKELFRSKMRTIYSSHTIIYTLYVAVKRKARRVISMRDLKPGDVVHVQGIVCEIAEIAWLEPWDWREAYYLEFRDTNGIYRSWKQNFDGGYAELKGE